MDTDELRHSQRRHKKPNSRSEVLTTPSQESDPDDDLDLDDEEAVSTPSAEHADRNLLSALSARYAQCPKC